ncbi:uncharacterized protein V6R79_021455 [Siganus canaliculatus]
MDSCHVHEASEPPSWDEHQRWGPDHDEEEDEVETLRRRIKYYFMNPCEKFQARGRKPWKLVLQLVKIFVITLQLVSFGLSNQMVVSFTEENLQTFKHLFLKDYVDGQMAKYAVYRQADVYDHIDYVIEQFEHLHNNTVGNHDYERNSTSFTPLMLCHEFFRNVSLFPGNSSFEIDTDIDTECLQIYPTDQPPRLSLDFRRLLSVQITFVLKAINLGTVRHRELPDCYDFTVTVVFNNHAHSGRIKIDLETDVDINECRDWKVNGAIDRNIYLPVLFDCLIIIICTMSFVLCTRSVKSGIHLQLDYTVYCRKRRSKDVPWSDRLEFVNGWYILIILSDTLTIIGSILKIEIQTKVDQVWGSGHSGSTCCVFKTPSLCFRSSPATTSAASSSGREPCSSGSESSATSATSGSTTSSS